MNYNEHWSRWIKASIAKKFRSIVDTLEADPTHLYVEGFERDTENKQDWLELRVDGPYLEELTKGTWQLDVEVNILICVNEPMQNAYRPEQLAGLAIKLFTNCIDVFKLGNHANDDNTYLGCLTLRTDGRNRIIQSNFGKVRPDTRHNQSSVEGHYRMLLG